MPPRETPSKPAPCSCGRPVGNFHELKIWPRWFEAVKTGKKPWEIRKNDRGFMPGDVLLLKEFNNETGEFTGSACVVHVVNVWEDLPALELGYVVMDVHPVKLVLA